MSRVSGTPDDLRPGDSLRRLGAVSFAVTRDRHADPVLVADVSTGRRAHERVITTSAGTMYVDASTTLSADRDLRVRPEAALLVSRRPALHAALLTLGVPVVRRSTVAEDVSASQIDAPDWQGAPLVVVDAYLSPGSLSALFGRPGFTRTSGVVVVGLQEDPVDISVRDQIVRGCPALLLPRDTGTVRSLLTVATQ